MIEIGQIWKRRDKSGSFPFNLDVIVDSYDQNVNHGIHFLYIFENKILKNGNFCDEYYLRNNFKTLEPKFDIIEEEKTIEFEDI